MWVGEQTPLAKVYFHRFELSPIRLNITYLHSQKLVADLIRNPAGLLPNLDRAPIVLDAMVSARGACTRGACTHRACMAHAWCSGTVLFRDTVPCRLHPRACTPMCPTCHPPTCQVLQDTVTTAEQLQGAIRLSYKAALLRQFYKLLLRVELLSTPVRPQPSCSPCAREGCRPHAPFERARPARPMHH